MSDDQSASLRLITPPASEPISLASAKLFLRIEYSTEDEVVTRAITAARVAAEQYLGLALLPQTWDYAIANPAPTSLALPFGPAQSLTSLTLTTEAGASSTMNAANYRLSVDGWTIFFDPSLSIERLTVRYVAGIATSAAEIPTDIIQGMLHHIAAMIAARDGSAPMPAQSVVCYRLHRRVRL